MKRQFIVFMVALSMVILLIPCSPQAAASTASNAKKAAVKSSTVAIQPQTGGVWKILVKNTPNLFGYPPIIVGADKDFAAPFFNRLIAIGDDGKYKPELALSWNTSADGKTITFKLRKGVTFHDGTPFNAQAVKSNYDKLIPPNSVLINGITSVDVVDDYTVKFNLPSYNNLILYKLASTPVCYLYSPTAFQKNGKDWAATHPVGTGAFMLKNFEPNTSLTLVKNPNYWEKGLPYLDGMEYVIVRDPMSQVLAFKAGQANALFGIDAAVAAQLRAAGYPLLSAPGNVNAMSFDTKNSEMFSKPQVREAIEYAVDKEAICSAPGAGLFMPLYQIVSRDNSAYNKDCPPRKYDPAKAKKLLTEAGYPNGFSFKLFALDTNWKDGWVAVQSYLDKVGIKMEINYLTSVGFTPIRLEGKIENGASVFTSLEEPSHSLDVKDNVFRSNSNVYQFIVRPAGIDQLIDQAELAKDPVEATRIERQINKLIYDDETIVPLWDVRRIAIVDKSVHDSGWFVGGDSNNNHAGTRTWLKK